MRRWPWGLAILGAVGGSTYYYFQEKQKVVEEKAKIIVKAIPQVPKPDDIWKHPYDKHPWYWRYFFQVKRVAYLSYVFAPVLYLSLCMHIWPNDEGVRERFVDRLLATIQTAGAGFQKLGQWMSMRPDLFSQDVVDALSRLREAAPVHSFEATMEILRETLGRDPNEVFEEFDRTPIASGSVGQVYRARLRPAFAVDGVCDVAVKVRHPNVLDESYFDLDIIYTVINSIPSVNIAWPFAKDDFRLLVQQQLDFRWEAYNLCRFANNFAADPAYQEGILKFPLVFANFISDSVLVESWAKGRTIADLFSKGWSKSDDSFTAEETAKKNHLAQLLFDMNIKMFLRDNYVHGDLHAGNLLVDDNSVTVLDAGLVTSLDLDVRDRFGDFLSAVLTANGKKLSDCLLDFNVTAIDRVDVAGFRATVDRITNKWQPYKEGVSNSLEMLAAMTPDEIDKDQPVGIGDMVGELLLKLSSFGISLRGDVACCLSTITVSEGLILQLNPHFDMFTQALPYFVRYSYGFTSVHKMVRNEA